MPAHFIIISMSSSHPEPILSLNSWGHEVVPWDGGAEEAIGARCGTDWHMWHGSSVPGQMVLSPPALEPAWVTLESEVW